MTFAGRRYRKLWLELQKCSDEYRRDELGVQMDALVTQIASGPSDPRWKEFCDEMPPEFNGPRRRRKLD